MKADVGLVSVWDRLAPIVQVQVVVDHPITSRSVKRLTAKLLLFV